MNFHSAASTGVMERRLPRFRISMSLRAGESRSSDSGIKRVFSTAFTSTIIQRNFLDSERSDYKAQLTLYRVAAQSAFPGKPIHAALIIGDGMLWELDSL